MSVRALRPLALVMAAAIGGGISMPHDASAHKLNDVSKQRRHIKDRARAQKGTRYTYGGPSPRKGFDCSGFTSWVFKNHGANLPRSSRDQWKIGSNERNRRVWKRSKLKVGDLVFFKTTRARVGHVGIYIGNGRFISATSSRGIRVESVYDPYYWGRRWVGGVRHHSTRA